MSVQAVPPLEARQKPSRRRNRSAALYEVVVPLLATAGLFLLWEGACRIFNIPAYLLPSPTEIWTETMAIGPTVALASTASGPSCPMAQRAMSLWCAPQSVTGPPA